MVSQCGQWEELRKFYAQNSKKTFFHSIQSFGSVHAGSVFVFGKVNSCFGVRESKQLFFSGCFDNILDSKMLPFETTNIFEQLPRFVFKMPRVVPDQESKFQSDELFRRLSRESEVRSLICLFRGGLPFIA